MKHALWIRHAPITLLFVVVVFSLLQNRSQEAARLTLFFVLSHLINELIKRSLRHSSLTCIHRPQGFDPHTCGVSSDTANLGMPSGHTQAMFFLATYVTLARSSLKMPVAGCVLLWLLAFAVAYGRVHYECHTHFQVVMGALIGTAWAWFSCVIFSLAS
jgi:membrane-associated phospholipid phosphatase